MAGFVFIKLHACLETSYICINITFGGKIVLQQFHHFWKKAYSCHSPIWCHSYSLLLCVHFLTLYVFITSVIFCSPLMVIVLQYSYWILQLLQQESGQSPFFLHFNFFQLSVSNFRKKKPETPNPEQNCSSKQILQKLYNEELYRYNHCSNQEKTDKTQTVLQQFTQFPHAFPLTYTALPRDLNKQHFQSNLFYIYLVRWGLSFLQVEPPSTKNPQPNIMIVNLRLLSLVLSQNYNCQ